MTKKPFPKRTRPPLCKANFRCTYLSPALAQKSRVATEGGHFQFYLPKFRPQHTSTAAGAAENELRFAIDSLREHTQVLAPLALVLAPLAQVLAPLALVLARARIPPTPR